jgi:hypothetical protein
MADEFADLLASSDVEIVDTALTLRELMRNRYPMMAERVYQGWRGVGFHHPTAGYVCAIFPRARSVYLSFEKGVHLPDPAGRLVGAGRSVRSLEFTPADEIEGFEHYVDAAIDFAG